MAGMTDDFDRLGSYHAALDYYNISSKQVRIEANRSTGKVTFVLPCGQQRTMDRDNFLRFVIRVNDAKAWLTAPESAKKEF